jgi:DNA-binding MarR family transcriptional regulator
MLTSSTLDILKMLPSKKRELYGLGLKKTALYTNLNRLEELGFIEQDRLSVQFAKTPHAHHYSQLHSPDFLADSGLPILLHLPASTLKLQQDLGVSSQTISNHLSPMKKRGIILKIDNDYAIN